MHCVCVITGLGPAHFQQGLGSRSGPHSSFSLSSRYPDSSAPFLGKDLAGCRIFFTRELGVDS